jgi:molecular chaperone GrpE
MSNKDKMKNASSDKEEAKKVDKESENLEQTAKAASDEENVDKKSAPESEDAKEEKSAPLTKEEELQQKLETSEKSLEEYKDKYLRLAAEFDNYRKRTMKEKTELILNGSEKCINSILPILDDFERALANMDKSEDVKAITDGIKLIHNKFVQVLGQNGVKEIETDGKELDTDFHEAIALVPVQDEKQKGKIIDCTQKGYTLNEKVIRHAKVVIGQ